MLEELEAEVQTNNRNVDFFEKESVGRLLLKFSAPSIIGMIVTASYNVVDRIFVGRGVDALAITGITICFPMTIILIGFGLLVGIGAAAMISIRLGQQRKEEADKILGTAFFLNIVLSVLILVASYIFMEPLLRAFGGSGQALEYGMQFYSVFLIGAFFLQTSMSLNFVIRGDGSPWTAMGTMLIGGVLNMILNPLFIFVFDMGVRGSALATVFSQLVSCSWVLSYFLRRKSYVQLHLKNIKFHLPSAMSILGIGISPFIMQAFGGLIFVILNNEIHFYGGDIAIAAFGISNSVAMMIYMPIFGINQGLQPIIGYNYGAKRFDRIKRAIKIAMTAATLICLGGFILTMFFTEEILGIFIQNNSELVNIGTRAMRIYLLSMPLVGFQVVTITLFQSINKAGKALALTITRNGALVIPLLLILPTYYQLDGIWMTGPICDSISAVVAAVCLIYEVRILRKMSLAVSQ